MKTKIVKLKVKPTLIFRPTEKFGKLSPDPDTTFFLLDRVVNVEMGITVPVGIRGTVVGILQGSLILVLSLLINISFLRIELEYKIIALK